METSRGRTDPSVKDLLLGRSYEFEFFQAVRLLAKVRPQRRPVGTDAPPASEIVRFSAHKSLAFPASSIHEIEDRGKDRPLLMTVAFLGLTGPQGLLPSFYTEDLIARGQKKDRASAAFFDIFNHRLLSLFYRAWEKHHFPISYEREQAQTDSPNSKRFTQYLFDLIGMGTSGFRNRLRIPDESLLFYAGLLAQKPHSASALRGMLRDYFGVPVEIEQFRGKWFQLEPDALTYLQPGRGHNQLGFGTIAGDAIWNPQARFRVRIGALTYRRFAAFLPGGKALVELRELVGFFVGGSMEFEIQLVLLASEVPPCVASDEVERAPLLGLSSWLDRRDMRKDAGDVILEGGRLAA